MILPNLALKVVSEPSNDPVSLADAKLYLRVTDSADDDLITSLITAATRKVENYINQFLITQTWKVTMDHIPLLQRDSRDSGGALSGGSSWQEGTFDLPVSEVRSQADFFHLPRGPVQSISSFNSVGRDDSLTAFTEFNLDNDSDAPRIYLKSDKTWPTDLRSRNAIQITVVYGYGNNEIDVPGDITTAIKIVLTPLYEDRGCENDAQYAPNGKASSMPSGAACLLDPYTIERLE